MRIKTVITGLVFAVLVLFSSVSCAFGGRPVTVSVNDNGNTVTVEGNSNMTVEELLRSGGISVGLRDVVEPELKQRLSQSDTDSVTIKRFAKATVTDGSATRQVELSGGTIREAIVQAGFDINLYKTSSDMDSIVTDGMTIVLTLKSQPTTAATTTQPAATQAPTAAAPATLAGNNSITGNDTDGHHYVGSDGKINSNYCDGVTVGGKDWIVICGEARRVETESDKTLFLACKDVAKWTNTGMSKEDKLKVCFDSIKSDYLEGVRHNPPYREDDWHVVCANDIFVYGKGDCYSFGAAFAYVGRAIGYTECYAVNSGGHGWAEINGLIYDPEWSMHSKKSTYFGLSYDEKVDVPYASAISDGAEWKKKKIS